MAGLRIEQKKDRNTNAAVFNVLCVMEDSIATTYPTSLCALRHAFYFTIILRVTDSVPEVSVQK